MVFIVFAKIIPANGMTNLGSNHLGKSRMSWVTNNITAMPQTAILISTIG